MQALSGPRLDGSLDRNRVLSPALVAATRPGTDLLRARFVSDAEALGANTPNTNAGHNADYSAFDSILVLRGEPSDRAGRRCDYV